MNYWKHKANKNRTVGSDSDRIISVMSAIPRGYNALTYQTIPLPKGKYGQRNPDITIKICGYTIPIELDGGVHGFNDEISETKKTKDRNDDYIRDNLLPIILNHEQLRELKIPEDLFIQCAIITLEPIFRSMKRLSVS